MEPIIRLGITKYVDCIHKLLMICNTLINNLIVIHFTLAYISKCSMKAKAFLWWVHNTSEPGSVRNSDSTTKD
jgi:hypothetical protein